jgi:hypothetical protein
MRQAITTKFLPCTNNRDSRIKATSGGGLSVVTTWDHDVDAAENHQAAAELLANKYGWIRAGERLIGGGTKDGYAFVIAEATN